MTLIKSHFSLCHFTCGIYSGGLPIGPEGEKQVAVSDSPTECVESGLTAKIVFVRQKSKCERILKYFL